MRKYLFIDLHMHSIYSNEDGCEASVEDLLYNANELSNKIRNDFIKRVNSANDQELIGLVNEFVPYFCDSKSEQQKIKNQIISSANIKQQLIENIANNTKCSISITDHQNITGSKEAVRLIKENPKKYSGIDFIPGIEVSVGLKCIEKNETGHSAFKKCHALAYNYDVNDPTFNAYSNLYNWKIPSTCVKKDKYTGKDKLINFDASIGQMVLYAKRKVSETTGKIIPMEQLEFLMKYNDCRQVREEFINFIKNKYSFTEDKIKKFGIRQCFDISLQGNDFAISGSKWSFDEYISAIENAGGKLSIAHPYSIRRKENDLQERKLIEDFIDTLVKVTGEKKFEFFKTLPAFDKRAIQQNINTINHETGKNYSAEEIYQLFIDFSYSKDIQSFVEGIIKIKGDNNFGFEIFNKLDISGAKGKALYEIAKKYDLFLTAGSDHHGPSLHASNLISRCFEDPFIYSDDDLFILPNDVLQDKINDALKWSTNNYLSGMPFLEYLKKDDLKCNRQEISFYNKQDGTLSLSENLFNRHHTWVAMHGISAERSKIIYSTKNITHIGRVDFKFTGHNKENKQQKNDKQTISNCLQP